MLLLVFSCVLVCPEGTGASDGECLPLAGRVNAESDADTDSDADADSDADTDLDNCSSYDVPETGVGAPCSSVAHPGSFAWFTSGNVLYNEFSLSSQAGSFVRTATIPVLDAPELYGPRHRYYRCGEVGLWIRGEVQLRQDDDGVDWEGFLCEEPILLMPHEPERGQCWEGTCNGTLFSPGADDEPLECTMRFQVRDVSDGTARVSVNENDCPWPLLEYQLGSGSKEWDFVGDDRDAWHE